MYAYEHRQILDKGEDHWNIISHTDSRQTEKVVQCKLTDTGQLKATESTKLEGKTI